MQWQFHCFSLILNEESNNICLPIFSLLKYFIKVSEYHAAIETSKHFLNTVTADKPSG